MIDTGSTEVTGIAGWNSCSRCGERIASHRFLCDVCRQHPPTCEGQYTMPYPCMNCAVKDNHIASLEAKLKVAEAVVEAARKAAEGVPGDCLEENELMEALGTAAARFDEEKEEKHFIEEGLMDA